LILIPYRAKNPPERYPYVTLALMAANILIYALTSEYFLAIRRSVVEEFALSHNTLASEPWRLVTNIFLHADPMHLGGNMLFLWIFGPSVEGRLGHLKYLLVYLFAGLTADFLQDLVVGLANPEKFGLGASGAIMGLAGAYLWLFPYATISVVFGYAFFFWRFTLQEWQARWVALWFLGWDLLQGMLLYALGMTKYGGVGHFAHLGGALGGFVAVMVLRAKRDTEEYSEAQKSRVETGGHYPAMSLHELESLIAGQPENVAAIQAYCRKAVTTSMDGSGYSLCYRMLTAHGRAMVERGDPLATAQLMLWLPDTVGTMPSSLLLRLGSRLESEGEYVMAANVLRHIHRHAPTGPDTEMALLRLARLTEQTEPDRSRAAAVYAEMLRLFPNGAQSTEARSALRRLPPPTAPFTDVPLAAASDGAPEAAAPPPATQAPPGLPTVPGHSNVPGAPAMPMIAFDAPVSRSSAAAPEDGGGGSPLRPIGG